MKYFYHVPLIILFLTGSYYLNAQTATVSYPFAVGRTSTCGSGGSADIHYYTYNGTTNTLTNASGGVVGPCTPQLRIGLPANGTQRFSSGGASISYNPKDHKIYYLWTAYNPPSATLTGGAPARTFAWSWPIGSCTGTVANKTDTIRSFASDILGVAFDNNGNGYIIEFTNALPTVPVTYKAMIRSIDFSTGLMGAADTLSLTGGARIYQTGSGDVAMSPSGQMFFVVDNKLFTPSYAGYTGTGANLTCTYIDTVKTTNSFVGLTYAQGEAIAAYSGGGCPFEEIQLLTATNSPITKNTPANVYSASDLATVVSGVGAAKKLISAIPTGTPNQYDVVYDVYVQNYGNTDITNVQVTDNLGLINGIGNVSNITTSFVSNPAGLVLNPSYNGTTNLNLLNGTGTLPNFPIANNNCTIRISCRLSGILNGVVYNNSATATATGYNGQALLDVSTNGPTPDLNTNDKPDDAGENQPTPLLIAITAQTPPCATLSNILFTQNFTTGTGLSITIPAPVPGSGVIINSNGPVYTGSVTQPIALNTFTLTNNAQNANTADFISLTDHTGNANGRMMVINADAPANSMYSADFTASLCANQQYSVSFYAAFIGNSSYQTVCNGFGGFKYPKIKIRVRDAVSGLIITEANSGDIFSTSWGQYGLKFTSPASYSRIIIDLINDAPGGCGNDIALDDIQFGSCSPLPVVGLNNINAGCLGTAASFTAILTDPGVITGIPDYQWQISNDGISWSNIAAAPNNATYTIASVAAGDVNKYYRALVASAGNLSNPNCVYPSPSYFLVSGCDIDDDDDGIPDTVESGGVDPLNDDDMDGIPNYRDTNYPGFTDTNSDGINDVFDNDLDGVINELDRDSDNDGIPDVVEAGGVDADGDGKIDNYSDTDNDGFSQNVDANNTGSAGSGNGLGLPDTDGDGVPNYFDLDSDNDGIPDVVEVYGADANNDGKIDGYTDTDADGFSDNVDGDVGNNGVAENSSNALLRTGPDPDNDGRTNSYPYKNMDADSKANPYDLDSDGDGITDVTEAQFTDANFDSKVDGAINSKGRNISLAALGSLTIPNTDATGRSNPYDIDADDDGIPDNVEGLSTSSYYLPSGIDTDGDGIDNTYDNFVGFGGVGIPPNDQDGDTVPDYLDSDTDGDGKIDRKEGNDLNLNGLSDDLITLTGVDTDGDGLDDRFDSNNSSAEATSARMGNAGSFAGDPTPGSVTTVQRTVISGCAVERDWRCGGYVLNCEFTSFNAVLNNNITKLSWNAVCKQEVDYFVIERSTDRLHFNQVARVQSYSGLNEISSYELTDNIAAVETDIIFYRLKSVVNAQAKSTYSDIIAVKRKRVNEEAVIIFPNPVSGKLQILIEAEKETQADLVIIDKTGRKIYQFKSVLKKGNNSILFQQAGNLPSGLYFLHIQTGSQVINKKFTKL